MEGEEDPILAKTIDQHIAATTDKIATSLKGYSRVFIDGQYVEEDPELESGEEPIAAAMRNLAARGIQAVPVVGIDRVEAARDVASISGTGCCLRLTVGDLNLMFDLRAQIESLLAFLHLAPSEVDLIVDFGSKLPLRPQLPLLVQQFPYLSDWRSFTLASSAFPPDMTDIDRHSTAEIEREEWLSWLAVWNYRQRLSRTPTFGDYGINHPSFVDVDPRIMSMSPNIRYTGNLHYVIAKGEAFPKGKRKKSRNPEGTSAATQYQRLAREIMQHRDWCGADFSWGDQFIAECADSKRVGNSTQWRVVGTSHHIAYVVRQISNLL